MHAGPKLTYLLRAKQITTQDFNARLTGSDNRHHKYETVLAFDQRTRQLLDTLPAYFKYVQLCPRDCVRAL